MSQKATGFCFDGGHMPLKLYTSTEKTRITTMMLNRKQTNRKSRFGLQTFESSHAGIKDLLR